MAVLDATRRAKAKRAFIRRWFVEMGKTADLDDTEIANLIADIDDWLTANETAANQAIRATIRTKASTATKWAALGLCAMERAGIPEGE